ncbi:MAG: hypothetical protein ACRDPI_08485 [Nocardioidaceae bacterium]
MSDSAGSAANDVTRRVLLGGAGLTMAAVLAGCRPDTATHSPTPAKADPDVALTRAVLARERAALDLVEAIIARFPGLGKRLDSAATGHRSHVRLLTSVLPASPSARPTASASPTSGTAVPATRSVAKLAVARQEGRLVPAHREAALAARAGSLARVIASMGAAAAQQAALLGPA